MKIIDLVAFRTLVDNFVGDRNMHGTIKLDLRYTSILNSSRTNSSRMLLLPISARNRKEEHPRTIYFQRIGGFIVILRRANSSREQ